jgi:hypothetical protein
MTLNNIILRIKTIAESHKQVQRFAHGFLSDFLNDKTNVYPGVLIQDNGGVVSISNRSAEFNFKLFIVDLVHVSEETKYNEVDVQSDMISVALDLLTQFNRPEYTDWRVSSENSIQLLAEEGADMYAGCVMDISVSVRYTQNACAIPTLITAYVGDGDIEAVVPASGVIILRAYNTGNRVRVRIYEDTGTEEPQWEIEKL